MSLCLRTPKSVIRGQIDDIPVSSSPSIFTYQSLMPELIPSIPRGCAAFQRSDPTIGSTPGSGTRVPGREQYEAEFPIEKAGKVGGVAHRKSARA